MAFLACQDKAGTLLTSTNCYMLSMSFVATIVAKKYLNMWTCDQTLTWNVLVTFCRSERCINYPDSDAKIENDIVKVCLTKRGMLPLKDGNILVYSDGVSHKLWQSQGRGHITPNFVTKISGCNHSPFAKSEYNMH